MNDHSLHAPFIYQFYNEVIKSSSGGDSFNEVDDLKEQLLNDHRTIEIKDLGAGSISTTSANRKISEIAAKATSDQKLARFLFACGRYLKAQRVLELGTSLGITTRYLGEIGNSCKITTIEGADSVYEIAVSHLRKLSNIECKLGAIDEVLPQYLIDNPEIDMVYLDANHTYDATIRYYKMIRPNLTPGSIFVVGDIHWSKGMERAWRTLKVMEGVTLSVDLFYCGLLFNIPVQEKQDYVIWF